MESFEEKRARATRIAQALAKAYPEHTRTALNWRNPFELLISTILAAQTTDAKVNEVAPHLYARFPDAHVLSKAPIAEVEQLIHATGFFRNKARMAVRCAQALVEHHGGQVPRTMDALTALPGVGRKTANVVLTNCFGVPGIVVDTHVIRLAGRLELSTETDPEAIERDLMSLLEETEWSAFCHRLTHFGRQVCTARMPAHGECLLLSECPSGLRWRDSG